MSVIAGLNAEERAARLQRRPGARVAGAGQRLVALDRRHQVARLVAHVADVDRRPRADQVLREQVPLLRELRPQVRIPGADDARRPVERLQAFEAGGDGARPAGRVVGALRLEEERRVQRQAQVGAGAFHVLRDAVTAAEHPALTRAVGDADARLPALVVRLVERAAVAVLLRPSSGAALLRSNVRLAVVLLDERRGVAPAQAEVEGQGVGDLEVIGGVERHAVLQVRPRRPSASRGPCSAPDRAGSRRTPRRRTRRCTG